MKTFESGAQRKDDLPARYDLIPAEVLQLINEIETPLILNNIEQHKHLTLHLFFHAIEAYIIGNNAMYAFKGLMGIISIIKNKQISEVIGKNIIKSMLATTLHEGAEKYGDRNWEKGLPEYNLKNHALSHIYNYMEDDISERHLEHALCNLMFWFVLDIRGYYEKGS